MYQDSKIYVAGHRGMVGSAIVRKLRAEGFCNIITATSQELDLTKPTEVELFFEAYKPEYVFLAAAKVGGIWANKQYKADFIYQNLMIQNNVIYQAYKHKIKKLLFLGSSCIYPREAPQPLQESYLLGGHLEETNDSYAIAKIAGIKMCESFYRQYGCNFVSCMPTNLYGPNDNYHLENSHVLPALIRKFHEAKQQGKDSVQIWGTGTVKREFLHVDDLARACLWLMMHYNQPEFVNVGTGEDISIKELAELIRDTVGYQGQLDFDTSKPDGTPRKVLDVSKLSELGFQANIPLVQGIAQTYQDFAENYKLYTFWD